ncbi:MAG: ABC transporter substrate-binding protein [Actinomycetota bacterium]|nr:ABC transporter substrate-binding protein [Actinomycetota bacterium]
MGFRERLRRRTRRGGRAGIAVAAGLLVAAGLTACSSSSGAISINLYGGASETGFAKLLERCNQQAAGKYTIVPNLIPSDADGQRQQFVRRLAAKDSGMDILGMDVTWVAEFAKAGWITELTGDEKAKASAGVLAQPLGTATVQGKLYAIPRATNVQLLWYRKSLVPNPPKTWADMISQAQKLKSEHKVYQIGLTGAQYEGYVVAFNTILASYGGTFVNADSTKATIDSKTVQALTLLHNLATSGLASDSLSQDQEPQIFAELEQGRSAFIINWPYVLSAMRTDGKTNPQSKAIADDLGYVVYPQIVPGQNTKVTLGGQDLAISSYSKHPTEAYEAAMCLRDETSELNSALDAGNVPVLQSIYANKQFQTAYPMYPQILAELKDASTRPITPLYQNISTIVSTTLSPPAGIDPQSTANILQKDIQQSLDGRGILP